MTVSTRHSFRFLRPRTGALLLAAVMSINLASCNSPQKTVPPTDDSTAEKQPSQSEETNEKVERESDRKQPKVAEEKVSTKDRPKPIEPALKPGTYCYQLSNDMKDLSARVTIDSTDRVVGKMQGTIHDKKEGYFTSYDSRLNGTIDGSNLNLDIATWIEFDKQNNQQTWRVSPNELSTDREKLKTASCDVVNKIFQNENGLEAEDLTKGANNVKTQDVFFDAGKSSATVSGAVVRGDRDVYILNAQGGQIMYPTLTSVEDNAVFDVVDPSGRILATDISSTEQVYLPYTGNYQLIVGGTRGNATYNFAIAIE